jgi:type II secretory pathway pseudopilin PulG
MKHIRISESFMWAFLVIGGVAGAAMIGWQAQTDWNKLPAAEQQAVLESQKGETIAEDFLKNHFSLDVSSFQKASVLMSEPLPDTFIEQSYLSEKERTAYKDAYLGASTVYYVRFFKPETIEEYDVTVDAFRGTVLDFSQTLPEEAHISEVSEDEAIMTARKFVAEKMKVEPDMLLVHAKEEETYPGGVERIVTLSRTGSELDSKNGKGFVTYIVTVRGSSVVAFLPSFEYPEPYERALEKSGNVGMLVGFLSFIAWIAIIVAALVYMIRAFSSHTAIWKLTLGVVAILGVLSLVDFINLYPETRAWYDTIDSMSVYWIFTGAITILGIVVSSLMFFIPSVAGHTLAVGAYRERIAPLTDLPLTKDIKLAYRLALIRGYLLGILFLGFTLALYWAGETYLGVWYPYGEAEILTGLSSFVPAFTLMLSLGIMAAIMEEVTFRLFGILWISSLTKSTIIGVLVATVVWAFAHTDGSVLPVWFRGSEVLIGGLLFAYFFIRYNILTTIVAHYVHNIIIAGILLLFTFGTAQIMPVILIFFMPAIVYLLVELGVNFRTKS